MKDKNDRATSFLIVNTCEEDNSLNKGRYFDDNLKSEMVN